MDSTENIQKSEVRLLILKYASSPLIFIAFFLAAWSACFALNDMPYISETKVPGSFRLVEDDNTADLFVDAGDHAGVRRAAADLQADIARVTAQTPEIINDPGKLSGHTVIIGTIGKNRLIIYREPT